MRLTKGHWHDDRSGTPVYNRLVIYGEVIGRADRCEAVCADGRSLGLFNTFSAASGALIEDWERRERAGPVPLFASHEELVTMRRSSRQSRALELRDMALALVRERGKWESAGNMRVLMFKGDNGLMIAHRTPFQRIPEDQALDELSRFFVLATGKPLPVTLPYGLDVWHQGKRLDVEWSDDEHVEVRSYKAGKWEGELERLAAGQSA